MSATKARLYDDLAAGLRTQLAEASELLEKRDALIKHLRRENDTLRGVRLELLDELRSWRLGLRPYGGGFCAESSATGGPGVDWSNAD